MGNGMRSLLAALCAVAIVGAAPSDGVGDIPAAASQTVLAFRVAGWARARGDARAMIVAARMLSEVPGRDAGGETAAVPPVSTSREGPARGSAADGPRRSGDPRLGHRRRGGRGQGRERRAEPLGHRDTAGGSWTFRFAARGGETLYVVALSDGDAPLDLELRDPADRLVCASVRGLEVDCRTRPSSSALYSARIFNRGGIVTRALAVSN